MAEQIFEQHFEREGKARNIADVGALKRVQAIDIEGIAANAQRGPSAERIFRCGTHAGMNSPLCAASHSNAFPGGGCREEFAAPWEQKVRGEDPDPSTAAQQRSQAKKVGD